MKCPSTLVVFQLTWLSVLSLAAIEVRGAERKGWQELFNGKDLTGWQNASGEKPSDKWVVEDGAIVRTPGAGMIWTKARFPDFVLSMEFKTEGNSGIFFRTDDPKNCVQTGFEIQVYRSAKQPGKHSCGAVYDAVAPSKDVVKDGQWNRIVITAMDNKIGVKMNGQQIVEMDLNRWTEPGKNPDGSKNKFRTALKDFKREGHIGLQDHGANVAFRNIRIRQLKKK